MCKELEDFLDMVNSENTWLAFKECVYDISHGVLCFVERKHKDWVGNDDAETEDIL